MIVGPGVEIRPGAVDRDLLHQTGIAEGAQRVVDGGQRDPFAVPLRLGIEAFCGDVAVHPVPDQQGGQCHPLPRRAQTNTTEPGDAARHLQVFLGLDRTAHAPI